MNQTSKIKGMMHKLVVSSSTSQLSKTTTNPLKGWKSQLKMKGAKRPTPTMNIRVNDIEASLAGKYSSNETMKSSHSKSKALNKQNEASMSLQFLLNDRKKTDRLKNEGFLLRNFMREFHDTMIETVGYSEMKELFYPDAVSDIDKSGNDLDEVEMTEVNLIEILWRLRFINPDQSGVDS